MGDYFDEMANNDSFKNKRNSFFKADKFKSTNQLSFLTILSASSLLIDLVFRENRVIK